LGKKGIMSIYYFWRCPMAVTYKRQDGLEKMLEEFASFENLDEIEYPDPKSKINSGKNNLKQDDK
jgi:hypothetical protein